MRVLLTYRGLAVCLAVAASACASGGNERAPATAATPPSAQTAGQPSCEAISRFSRTSFLAADRNRDGYVDEAEFAGDVAAAFAGEDSNMDHLLTRSELTDAPSGTFERLDAGNSGALSFRQLMDAKAAEFRSADANGDGVLSMTEVTRFNARQGGC